MEEPEAGQGALPRPEVLGAVIHLHLHPVVPVHALPVTTSDEKPVAQRHHPTVLMECVQELHLCEGQGEMCGDPPQECPAPTTEDIDPPSMFPHPITSVRFGGPWGHVLLLAASLCCACTGASFGVLWEAGEPGRGGAEGKGRISPDSTGRSPINTMGGWCWKKGGRGIVPVGLCGVNAA